MGNVEIEHYVTKEVGKYFDWTLFIALFSIFSRTVTLYGQHVIFHHIQIIAIFFRMSRKIPIVQLTTLTLVAIFYTEFILTIKFVLGSIFDKF